MCGLRVLNIIRVVRTILCVILVSCIYIFGQQDTITQDTITIESKTCGQTCGPLQLLVGIIEDKATLVHKNSTIEMVCQLKKDLERSGQFLVTTRHMSLPATKKEISTLHEQGFVIACFLSVHDNENYYEWRLYDTVQAEMIKGKKTQRAGAYSHGWAHMLAQDLWKELMGQVGNFTSKLAYTKRLSSKPYNCRTQLCICDFDGLNERVIVDSSRILVAPCWAGNAGNDNYDKPYIFYSQFKEANVCLMSSTLNGHKKTVIDFDGTTVGVSTTHQPRNIVYGRSGGIWMYSYDVLQKKGSHKLIIKEKDICASPTHLVCGDIIYCCQAKIKRYYGANDSFETLIGEGYNVGPAVCEINNSIVYSRRVNGVMQLFVYSMETKNNKQITFDSGDKIDACWSPCGNWVAYCLEIRGKSSIYQVHIKSGISYRVTPEGHDCRYPAWSGALETYYA